MFCGLALKRIELPPSTFFLFTRLRFFAHFFTPKNTLVIVTEILLYIYIIHRYRKEIRFLNVQKGSYTPMQSYYDIRVNSQLNILTVSPRFL